MLANCWLIFGKLWEARSRLYRRQFVQVILVWKLLTRSTRIDLHVCVFWEKRTEIENEKWKCILIKRFTHVCTAPHSKFRLNFVKHFRMFAVVFSSVCVSFAIMVQNSHAGKFFIGNSAICTERIKISQSIKFPGISQRLFLKISENDFRNVTKYRKN